MPKKKLECIGFLENGKWVKADDKSKVVNPRPIGEPFSGPCYEEDGPSRKDLEKSVRDGIKWGLIYTKQYNKVNAYSYHVGNQLGAPDGTVQIQLHQI